MKKSFYTTLLLLIGSLAFAQEGVSNIGFSVGFVEPTQYYRVSAAEQKLTGKLVDNGVKLGVRYETGIIKGFGVAMELNYAFAADVSDYAAVVGQSTLFKQKEDHFRHYLELPVDWQYKFLIAKQTYLTVYTGPTLQVGLANYYHIQQKLGDKPLANYREDAYKADLDGDGKLDMNRLNVTWGVGLGFQYKRYFLRGGYDFGIMSIYRDPFFNTSTSNESSGWNRRGRLDQWQIKLGIYLWEIQ